MKIAAIIVAAGRGERAGGETPKQLRMLGDKRVFEWSLSSMLSHPAIDQCVLVVPKGSESEYVIPGNDPVAIVTGGASRTESVRAGLSACREDTSRVLIHDAARPGLSHRIISELLAALDENVAAAPALKVIDALKRKHGSATRTVDRTDLYRVQTPQAFHFDKISAALESARDLVDDIAAIEARNGKVGFIEGEERLTKITYAEDFVRLEKLLMPDTRAPRMGTGFDVHAFEPGDHVTLCGVAIPHDQKLAGHSDADVAWHALTDAILGASALGDIGDHFPPSDPKWKNADSALFLDHAVSLAAEAGWVLSSCDLTVICEAPKVKPHRETMRTRTSEVTGLPIDAISVKATTTEALGFTGRREGIAAMASAVLTPLKK